MNLPNHCPLARVEVSGASLAIKEPRQAVCSLRFGVCQFTRC